MLSKIKKFRLVYYIIYGLVVLLLLILASDVKGAMQLSYEWGLFRYYGSELPRLVSRFLFFVGIFMMIAVAIENYFTYQKRKELKDLDLDVTRLKAKLYDKEEELKELQSTLHQQANIEETVAEVSDADEVTPEPDKHQEDSEGIN